MAVAFVRSHTVTSEKVSDVSVDLAISTATTPGNVLVARVLFDNAAGAASPTVSSIAVPAGETSTWARLGSALYPSAGTAGAFASGEMWAIRASVPWPVASYTVTLSAAVTQKATHVAEFSGALATLRSTVGTAYSTTTTAASATTTGTAPVTGDLAVGFIFGSNVAAAQAGDTDTTAGAWSAVTGIGSTGGSGATNNFGVAQYKILTTATHQTLNNSAAMTAGNGAIVAILQQYVPPAITQAAFGFYADGTETGSTALAAQDTTPTVDTSAGDVNAQLRVRLQSTSAAAVDPWDDFQLQWEKNTSGTWAAASPAAFVTGLDSSFMNAGRGLGTVTGGLREVGQSFVGDGHALLRTSLYLSKVGTPTGNLTAKLYAVSGSVPTGAALATSSTTVPIASLAGSDAWFDFEFDGTLTLTNGVPYFAALVTDQTANDANFVYVNANNVNAYPSGVEYSWNGTTWASAGYDCIFRVYGPASTVATYNSPNLTNAAATTNRLTGGSGTFTAGKVSEDGLADDVGFGGNNHTELLYSLTFKAADLADGDTLRFRVLRNGSTTGLTYTQTPTVTIGGTGGPVAKPLSGTVAGTTTTTGAPVGVHPLAGLTAALTATAGAIEKVAAAQDYPLAGVVVATSATTTGTPTGVHPLTGTVPGATTTAGTIGMVAGAQAHPLTGTLPVTSTTAGALSRLNLALAATVAAVALTSGAPTAVHPLGGTSAATTTTTGALGSTLTLTGAAAVTSAASGGITAVHPLAGVVDATSATVGTASAVHPLTPAAVSATTTTSGTINLVGGPQTYPLAGASTATTTTTGTLRARFTLAGTSAATSTTTGAFLSVGGRPKAWTGTGWASKPVKVWSGSAWVEKPVKAWTGATWKPVT